MNSIKKPAGIFFLICISLTLLFPGSKSSASPSEEVLPPDILPVVILSGSDYDMGFQYGEQAGAFIEKTKQEKWASALEQYTKEEVIKALKANQHYIQKYTPEWIETMKGMADGAVSKGYSISYTDVLLMNCTLPQPETSQYPEGANNQSLPPKKCSVCSAWGSATKDGKLIGIDTLDSSEVPYGVVIVAFPDKGNEALAQLAEAATCFTRCQAHALQVYEALVPPPTSPSDLGLLPFGGDWALWETRIK
ncbi:MAG: hypothetical protein R6V02_10965 [Candidatus Aminicenantes bacterium]